MRRIEPKLLRATRRFKGGGGKAPRVPLQPRKGQAIRTISQSQASGVRRRFRGFAQSVLTSGLGSSVGNNNKSILGG